MLLKSIELKNFRQFINEKIDFSTDEKRNVTLIIGDNGTGKTTFAQSFFWCFYGETEFKDKIMLNRKVSRDMLPDHVETVKVIVKLTHGSANYEIIRTQNYKKTYNNKLQASNTELNIQVKSDDGNTRFLSPNECETTIKDILPKELANYFFFDGERIEKMSKEITAGKKSTGFSNAVIGLTGLKATLAALNHLSPTRSTSVMGLFNDLYKDDSDGKIIKLSNEIEKLQQDNNYAEKRVEELEDEIAAAESTKKQAEIDIKQFEEGEKLQKQREKILRAIKDAKNLRDSLIKDLFKLFNNGITNFLGKSLTKRSLEILSTCDFAGKDIPEMHVKTIRFLLNRGTCICGTHLDPGTIPYNKVNELIDYILPNAIGGAVGGFINKSRAKYSREDDLLESVNEKLAVISKQDEAIEELEAELSNISARLDGNDVREQVRILNNKINECSKISTTRKAEKNQLLKKQGELSKEISIKENSRSELSLLDKNNRAIELYRRYTRQIYNEMLSEYQSKEIEVRTKLERYINEIFKSIYDGGLSLTIDEKYNISVYVSDFDGGVETSTAQSISVIFAFISAIIKMARENQSEKKDEAYSEPYPLVMDAPLSSFDKRRIKTICSAIPETAEQVIIFIKDTDGDLADTYLADRVMKKHYFEKIDEFNTRLR